MGGARASRRAMTMAAMTRVAMTMEERCAMPKGTRLIWHEETGSTNDDARALAIKGEAGPVWIAAARQTQGRGRRGRKWESPTGNLYATLLIRPECSSEKAAQLSFAAPLAILQTARALLPSDISESLRVKWPNDVLLKRRKIAGCLLESDMSGGRASWVACGIGINLAHAPKQTPYPAAALGDFVSPPPKARAALERLARAFDALLDIWRGEDGFSALRREWLANASGLGEEITVRLPSETLEGRFEGLDHDGALHLLMPSGETRRIDTGDVFFGRGGA